MELKPGAVLAGYRLVRPLGDGGFASVWLARRTGTFGDEKDVALKLIHLDDLAENRGKVNALIDEGRAVARISHAHVVDLYELGCEGRIYFAAMGYVRGWTFSQILHRALERRVYLPASMVIDLAIGACRGLGAAHAAVNAEGSPLRLVHRDVKPSNLMLDAGGTVKVVDFGIARAETNLHRTAAGTGKGTPYYMSPEQWRMVPASPATDLFALAAVISEMATGRVLFRADSLPAVMTRILTGDPAADAFEVAARIPSLAPILERCLARDPHARPASAGEVERELLRVRRGIRDVPDLAQVAKLVEATGAEAAAVKEDILAECDDGEWQAFVLAFDGSAAAAGTRVVGAGPAPARAVALDDQPHPAEVPTTLAPAGRPERVGPARPEPEVPPTFDPPIRSHGDTFTVSLPEVDRARTRTRFVGGVTVLAVLLLLLVPLYRGTEDVAQVAGPTLPADGPPSDPPVAEPSDEPPAEAPTADPPGAASGKTAVPGDGPPRQSGPGSGDGPVPPVIVAPGGKGGEPEDPPVDEPQEPPPAEVVKKPAPPSRDRPVSEPSGPLQLEAGWPSRVETSVTRRVNVRPPPGFEDCQPVLFAAPGDSETDVQKYQADSRNGVVYSIPYKIPDFTMFKNEVRFRLECRNPDGRVLSLPPSGWSSPIPVRF